MATKPKIKTETRGSDTNKRVFPDALSPAGFLTIWWAAFLDLVSLIPFISIISGFMAMGTLGYYEWKHAGEMPISRKMSRILMRKYIPRLILEAIPIINVVPLWTIYVVRRSGTASTRETEINQKNFEYAEE